MGEVESIADLLDYLCLDLVAVMSLRSYYLNVIGDPKLKVSRSEATVELVLYPCLANPFVT